MIVMNFAGGRAMKFGSTVSHWTWESVFEAVRQRSGFTQGICEHDCQSQSTFVWVLEMPRSGQMSPCPRGQVR